jgi:hypothetical protein
MPYPHEESRQLTADEYNSLHPDFPQMNPARVLYIGGATRNYNCLAWSLGVQSSWIWPWPSGSPVSLDDFRKLYKDYGVNENTGPIDLWGKTGDDMKHGSIS